MRKTYKLKKKQPEIQYLISALLNINSELDKWVKGHRSAKLEGNKIVRTKIKEG